MTYYIGSSLGAALGALAYASAGWSATVGISLGAMAVAGGITYYGTRSAAAARRRRLREAHA
jgi:YNFM family putative membrane transporter